MSNTTATFLPPKRNAERASSSGTGHVSSSPTFRCIFPPIHCRSRLRSRYQEMAKLGTLRTQTAAPGARAEGALRSPAGRSRASAHRGGRPVTARVTSHGPGAAGCSSSAGGRVRRPKRKRDEAPTPRLSPARGEPTHTPT